MTDPRGDAPKPIDDDSPRDDREPTIDDREPTLDDADIDAIEGDLADEAQADDIDADDDDEFEADDVDADEAAVDDYEAALREVAGEDVGPAVAAPAPKRRSAAAATTRAPTPSEIAVHVREDVSKVFVIATVAIFVLILLNGVLLGTGGVLRPLATPTPRRLRAGQPRRERQLQPQRVAVGQPERIPSAPSASPSAASPSPASPSPAASPS